MLLKLLQYSGCPTAKSYLVHMSMVLRLKNHVLDQIKTNTVKCCKKYQNIHSLTASMPISWKTKVRALEKHQK